MARLLTTATAGSTIAAARRRSCDAMERLKPALSGFGDFFRCNAVKVLD